MILGITVLFLWWLGLSFEAQRNPANASETPQMLSMAEFDARFGIYEPELSPRIETVDPDISNLMGEQVPTDFYHAPVTSENISQHITGILENYEDYSMYIDPMKAPLYVHLDITRGIQKATVYKYGQEVKSFKIRGGRNRRENSEGKRVCAYTTTGRMIPTALIWNKTSREHDGAPMPWHVELDKLRGVGTHQGSFNSFSAACIRIQTIAQAKELYGWVKEVSTFKGKSATIDTTGAIFDVVDNTNDGDIAREREECMQWCRQKRCGTPHLTAYDGAVADHKRFRQRLFMDPMEYMKFRPNE